MLALLVPGSDLEDVAPALRLGWEGVEIMSAGCPSGALRQVEARRPNIVVIDISGGRLDLVREIRKRAPRSVVVAVSPCYRESELVSAVDAGCDDYMQVPVNPTVFVARVRAALRRVAVPQAEARTDVVACGALQLDPSRYEARVDGYALRLTAKEFHLLLYLAQRDGQVVPHETLSRLIWGEDSDIYAPWLRKHIQHVRQKLACADADVAIVSVPRVGYKLVAAGRSQYGLVSSRTA